MTASSQQNPALVRIVGALQRSGSEMDHADELAEIIWLASQDLFLPKTANELPKLLRGPIDDVAQPKPEPPPTGPTHFGPGVKPAQPPATKATDKEADAPVKVPPPRKVSKPEDLSSGELLLRVPAARALPDAPALARALRPFRRRVAARTQWVLDEEETVSVIAASRLSGSDVWCPVLKPARARWLEIALVIDNANSMTIWRDTLLGFRSMLERLGGFRDIRVWWLDTASAKRISLLTRPGSSLLRTPGELSAADGRRIILLASDCLAPAWQSGEVGRMLVQLGRQQPVAILQMLPTSFWRRTTLDPAVGTQYVTVGAREPGAPNNHLTRRRFRARRREPAPPGTPIPVITLEAEMLAAWAKLIHRVTPPNFPAVILPSSQSSAAPGNGPAALRFAGEDERARAIRLVDDYRRVASDRALRLAGLLAAAPLRLPVMRLVHRLYNRETSRQLDLAEFFLSNLIRRQAPLPPPGTAEDPDMVDYEFEPGVRDVLLSQGLLADMLGVQKVVSAYLNQRFGQTLDFCAIVITPEAVRTTRLGEENRIFARIAAHVLRRLGGRYAPAAAQIDPPESVGTAPNPAPSESIKQPVQASAKQPGKPANDLSASPVLKRFLDEIKQMPRELRGIVAARAVWRFFSLLEWANPNGVAERYLIARDYAASAELSVLNREGLDQNALAGTLDLPTGDAREFICLASAAASILGSTDDTKVLAKLFETLEKTVEANILRFQIQSQTEVIRISRDDLAEDLNIARELASEKLNAPAFFEPQVLGAFGPIRQVDGRPFPDRPRGWVLVAGQAWEGSSDLNKIAGWLGYTIAVTGFGLVVGGQSGVDENTTRAFVRRIRQWGIDPDSWLIQILEPYSQPRIVEGRIIKTSMAQEALTKKAEFANAAVFVGGGRGTMLVATTARDHNVPLFPIRQSGGAADQIYQKFIDVHAPASIELAYWLAHPPLQVLYRLPGMLRNAMVQTASRKPAAKREAPVPMAIVRVINPQTRVMSTGLVLQKPAVIITTAQGDYFRQSSDGLRRLPDSLQIIDSESRPRRCQVLGVVSNDPFGPVVLSPPPTMLEHGLKLRKSSARIGERMAIFLMSDGDRPEELAYGTVTGLLASTVIEPIGTVKNLVTISANLSLGSSGSPVIDGDGLVAGMIIGSSTGEALMYPTNQWYPKLQELVDSYSEPDTQPDDTPST